MENMAVAYKGKPYKYILTLLNVFSRFQWLYPLESKHSSGVKKTLKKFTLCMNCHKNLRMTMVENLKSMSKGFAPLIN